MGAQSFDIVSNFWKKLISCGNVIQNLYTTRADKVMLNEHNYPCNITIANMTGIIIYIFFPLIL